MANYSHLSYEDRKNIENGLNDNKSIMQIANEINRNHSTILREIDRNKVYYKPNNYGEEKDIDRKLLYKYSPCDKLKKSTYVFNGCKSRSSCRKERYTYYARKADDSYIEIKSKARKEINLTPEEVYLINTILNQLIKKGQTINHLYINHPNILNFSKPFFL